MVFRNSAARWVPGKSESSAGIGFNVVISIAAPLAGGGMGLRLAARRLRSLQLCALLLEAAAQHHCSPFEFVVDGVRHSLPVSRAQACAGLPAAESSTRPRRHAYGPWTEYPRGSRGSQSK